ncbi:MAG TPA: hypothetical protein VFY14_04200 [Streptomyces sp.]|nr:hypothetical protein [Streptomyces sp.]
MPVRHRSVPLAPLPFAAVPLSGGGFLEGTETDREPDVRLMRGSLCDDLADTVVRDFERRNPGAEAEVPVQERPGTAADRGAPGRRGGGSPQDSHRARRTLRGTCRTTRSPAGTRRGRTSA